MVAHLNTNWALHGATSLMCTKLLPLHQTNSSIQRGDCKISVRPMLFLKPIRNSMNPVFSHSLADLLRQQNSCPVHQLCTTGHVESAQSLQTSPRSLTEAELYKASTRSRNQLSDSYVRTTCHVLSKPELHNHF